MTKQTKSKEQSETKPEEEKKVCGVVMPIAACDNCSEHHWSEVKSIIFEAIGAAGFKPNMVSDADEIGVIQARIVQNLYDNLIVICDVSGKNANVMFELGMRLAFDKPTIIIKDDKTDYSFDTGVIEHLGYPRDLRFRSIVDFKEKLVIKIKAMEKVISENPGHSVFLKHFGKFKIARMDEREVTTDDYIIEQIKDMKALIMKNFAVGEHSYEQPLLFSPIDTTRIKSKSAYEAFFRTAIELIRKETARSKQMTTPLSVDEITECVYLKLSPIIRWSDLFDSSEMFYNQLHHMVKEFV